MSGSAILGTYSRVVPPAKPFSVHLLDVGTLKYGDAVLLRFGADTVLIDGGHTNSDEDNEGHIALQDQIGELLGQDPNDLHVSLLVVTHAHEDHIGCLPELVARGALRADWALVADPDLGWGTTEGDAPRPIDLVADARVRTVALALRESSRPPLDDAAALQRFLADVADQRGDYERMLEALGETGRVVRHGRDSTTALTKRFAKSGLRIVGPSKRQLELTGARVTKHTDEVIAYARQLFAADASADAVDAYRRLVATAADAADAAKRLGNEVNLQSIVTTFRYGGRRFLFAGDMQFTRPGSSDDVETLVTKLRRDVRDGGPYDLVKLCHHGSDNGWDEDMFEELGRPPYVGICAGERSTLHPHREVLADLRSHRKETTWARTDRNRQVTFDFTTKKVRVTKDRGRLNDADPAKDEVLVLPPSLVRPPLAGEVVEIVTRAPRGAHVTITVEPGGVPGGPPRPAGPSILPGGPSILPGGPLPRLDVAGGRGLPRLLVVTGRDALADNIGTLEADHVLAALRAKDPFVVYDRLPRAIGAATATSLVRDELRRLGDREGVLLLGGYDVAPPLRVFCVPDEIRDEVDLDADHDSFTVWSDDGYGDTEGDRMPELPVSRIPDGRSAPLVFAAVQAGTPDRGARRTNIRNAARPFADDVHALVPGAGTMLRSGPAVFDRPDHRVDGDSAYLMLHGSYEDATTFWGGEPWHEYPVVQQRNVPGRNGQVVFTGCCWGALTVDTPAGLVVEGRPVAPRTPESSLALRFLLGGATAFIGCTGSHWSPDRPPYSWHGRPMHDAFWSAHRAGRSPARALFEARRRFARDIPHGRTDPLDQAIDVKIHRQYTCLGLGW